MSPQPAVPPSEPAWDPSRFPPALPHSRIRATGQLFREPIQYLTRARRELGPVFTVRMLPFQGLVCAADAATNKEVLTDQDRFAAGQASELLVPWIGHSSLIVTSAPRHLPNRKLLLPPFHGSHVAKWGEQMRELVSRELDVLPNDEPVAIRPVAQRLALDVILQLVFGLRDERRIAEFREALEGLLHPTIAALLPFPKLQLDLGPLSPGGVLRRRRDRVVELIEGEVAARRAADEQRDDVLSLLLGAEREDGSPGFTDAELVSELRGLVVAGHETTATALAWTLHLLAHNPGAQDRLRETLDAGEDEYLKAVIKESMRIRPPVFDAIRRATTDTQLGGQPVPGGSYVSAMFTVTHHDPELWPEPDRFRPERHLGEDAGTETPYSLTPFGGGVRRCLGASLAQLELEAAIREVVGRSTLEPAGDGLEDCRLHSVTLIPAKGGRVTLRPRDRTERRPQPVASAA